MKSTTNVATVRRRATQGLLTAMVAVGLAFGLAPVASATVADDYNACKKEQGPGSAMLCCVATKNSRGDYGTPVLSGGKQVACKWASELSP